MRIYKITIAKELRQSETIERDVEVEAENDIEATCMVKATFTQGEFIADLIDLGKKKDKLMRQFNLEEAKEGKPVQLANGRKCRIICFDRRTTRGLRLVVLVENVFSGLYKRLNNCYPEVIGVYTLEGNFISDSKGNKNKPEYSLVMVD